MRTSRAWFSTSDQRAGLRALRALIECADIVVESARPRALAQLGIEAERLRSAKSVGSERTLSADVTGRKDIEMHLRRSADRVARRLRRKHYQARGVRIKLKTTTFKLLTRQRRLNEPSDVADTLYHATHSLLDELLPFGPFRLVGLAAFDLAPREGPEQPELFDGEGRSRDLESTIDGLLQRFGDDTVFRAADLVRDRTLGGEGPSLDFLDETP